MVDSIKYGCRQGCIYRLKNFFEISIDKHGTACYTGFKLVNEIHKQARGAERVFNNEVL